MMMKVSQVPVKEPEGDIQFSSQEKLYDHVCRHVLRHYGQRWGQFINTDLLNKARKEIYEPAGTANLEHVGLLYEDIVREVLLQLCREGCQHWHHYRRFSKTGKRAMPRRLSNGAWQTIQAWDNDKKLMIFARSIVRNGKFMPYVICSAYRPFSEFSAYGFREEVKRRDREKYILRGEILIADHDIITGSGETDWNHKVD